MNDVLIPLGLLLFIGLFAYAMIHSARQQRSLKAGVFKDYADKKSLCYHEEDDGKAQDFAHDFDGIGLFKSSSLGQIVPQNVVHGRVNGVETILFRHSTRFSEGWAREWFVAGITCDETIAESCAVQFCRRQTDRNTMYLQDPIVAEKKVGSFTMVVRAKDATSAGSLAEDKALEKLAVFAGNLSFCPEMQVRGNRIVAYLADRNAEVENVETLEELLEFTKKVVDI